MYVPSQRGWKDSHMVHHTPFSFVQDDLLYRSGSQKREVELNCREPEIDM